MAQRSRLAGLELLESPLVMELLVPLPLAQPLERLHVPSQQPERLAGLLDLGFGRPDGFGLLRQTALEPLELLAVALQLDQVQPIVAADRQTGQRRSLDRLQPLQLGPCLGQPRLGGSQLKLLAIDQALAIVEHALQTEGGHLTPTSPAQPPLLSHRRPRRQTGSAGRRPTARSWLPRRAPGAGSR